MISRVTLATRLTLIVFIALMAVWVVAIAIYYRSLASNTDFREPEPARLVALATLMERLPARERTLVLASLASPVFEAHIAPTAVPAAVATPAPRDVLDRYAAVLGPRPLAIEVVKRDGIVGEVLPQIIPQSAHGRRFHIGLSDGRTLVIDARNPIVMTHVGLPIGFGAGMLGTIVAALALFIMLRETRPLARLAAAVDSVDLSGDPVLLKDARLSAPEIRRLIAAFNRLQTRLGGMLRARMALIGGISHDVRTFATRLRLRVDKIPDAEERDRAIADIDDMIRLLDDALLSSRAGAGELSLELVDLSDLVAAEVADRRKVGAPVFLTGPAKIPLPVLGDTLALRRILGNVIGNAVKYGHVARLSLARTTDMAVVTIDDEGDGIPEDQRAVMLEPFSRLEQSRNRRTGGAGLGLAVVRALVEAHEGGVAFEDAPGGGLRVVLTLPLFAPES